MWMLLWSFYMIFALPFSQLASIQRTKSGRCFLFEYICKMSIIYTIYIICFIRLYNLYGISGRHDFFTFLTFCCILIFPFLTFFSTKYSIQRLFDINKSKKYIYFRFIPIVSIFMTLYLFFQKNNPELNDYDNIVDYHKLFGNNFYQIYKNYVLIDDLKIFIRRENFKYTIIIEKNSIETFKEKIKKLNIPNNYFYEFEDEKYMYYNKISKRELSLWVKNVI